jgi:hypothetical protein
MRPSPRQEEHGGTPPPSTEAASAVTAFFETPCILVYKSGTAFGC